jgi:hypothetical protein
MVITRGRNYVDHPKLGMIRWEIISVRGVGRGGQIDDGTP